MGQVLEQFDVLLLDMNGTFMFGEDRFGQDENFYETYLALGGGRLGEEELTVAIQSGLKTLMDDYESIEHIDDFPSLSEVFGRNPNLTERDLTQLKRVFAAHEIGRIPPEYALLLQRLSRSHKLGLITNICGAKDLWLSEFQRAGISDVFACQVFSSDTRSIKPSATLFQMALSAFPPNSRVLFIGDSLRCDIIPAKALGLSTAWITSARQAPHADFVLNSLLDIEAFQV